MCAYLKGFLTPEVLPNVILCIVGIIGAWVAIRTLRILIRQTKSTEDAAKAALLSAQYMANGERAWLLNMRVSNDLAQTPSLLPLELGGEQTAAYSVVFLKNYGHSPATIIAAKFEMQIGDSRLAPPSAQLFDLPPFIVNTNPFVAPPGELVPPMEARLSPKAFISTVEERDDILVRKLKFLWLLGIVRYHDPFVGKQERETRICYLYETLFPGEPFWIPAGSAGWNDAK